MFDFEMLAIAYAADLQIKTWVWFDLANDCSRLIAVLEVDQARVVLLGRSFNRKRTSHKMNISLPAWWQTDNGKGDKC